MPNLILFATPRLSHVRGDARIVLFREVLSHFYEVASRGRQETHAKAPNHVAASLARR